jgi:two-component system phosphate regulon sensor histidine kinase PhoR
MSTKSTYPWFYFFRIARISLLVFLPTLFLVLILYRTTHRDGLVSQMNFQIEENLYTLKNTFEKSHLSPKDWCQQLPVLENARYSLVRRDGTILCDSEKERMGKKISDISEITESFQSEKYVTMVRSSDLFGTEAVFGSLKINEELSLRKVVPLTTLKDGMKRIDKILFFKILPIAFLSYLIFLFIFYRATAPLGVILSKVEKFKVDIPFNKTLNLLYQKDKWGEIEEALNEADNQLSVQMIQTKTENEKIKAILESIYDNIIAIDHFESILFYNSNFERNFQRPRPNQEIIPKIWHRFTDEKVLDAFRGVLKTGETISLKGMNALSSTHPDRFYDLNITPLRDPEGKISGALGVFYDMTEIKLTEQMRVDFVANVSHEIRTPLTSIKGYSQMLIARRDKMDPELVMFLDKILNNSERMISLFNDLLNLSVIESKNLIKMEELDLAEFMDSITDNIVTNYAQKKVDIQTDLKVMSIHGDRRLMEQVFSNLIDNSFKYSGDSLNLSISAEAVGDKVRIRISDNGPGISKEHIQRIFERFYRVDSSRESSRGTGLGLSIVKHIIGKHKGKIWAESSDGLGTTFFVELPKI